MEAKQPLSLQQFQNINFGSTQTEDYLFEYSCLKPVKHMVHKTIFPNYSGEIKCGLMLVTSLVEPDWIFVNCTQHLLPTFYCADPRTTKDIPLHNLDRQNRLYKCPANTLVHDHICYSFTLWSDFGSECAQIKYLSISWKTFEKFKAFSTTLAVATSAVLPPMLIFVENTNKTKSGIHRITVLREISLLRLKYDTFSVHTNGGLFVGAMKEGLFEAPILLKLCDSLHYITAKSTCDGMFDCNSDYSDEDLCSCKNKSLPLCRDVTLGNKQHCGELYFLSVEGLCKKFALRKETKKEHVSQSLFHCLDGKAVPQELENDLVADCGSGAEDEAILKLLLQSNEKVSCADPAQLPCRQGHSMCFNMSEVCVFRLDKNGLLSPCRTGGHLENCKDINCNTNFKCTGSHCIPWSFVSDGKWDCPNGEDEIKFLEHKQSLMCFKMFKCKASPSCIHVGSICNGVQDCVLGDDEQFCDLLSQICFTNCHCLLYALVCIEVFPFIPGKTYLYHSVFLKQSSVVEMPILLRMIPHVLSMNLSKNDISEICNIQYPASLLFMTIIDNNVAKLMADCISLQSLKILKLDHNVITTIAKASFMHLPDMQLLSLRNNPICKYSSDFLLNSSLLLLVLPNFRTLANQERVPHLNFVAQFVMTEDFHLCCAFFGHNVCITKKPWHFSCTSLLPQLPMLYLSIAISLLVLIINATACICFALKSNKAFKGTMFLVCFSDLLCATYLAILCIADRNYRGVFPFREMSWRSNPFCFSAMFLSFWFTVLVQLALLFLSLQRLMVVVHPVDSTFKRVSFVRKKLFALTTASFFIVLPSILLFGFMYHKSPSSICLPFLDPTQNVHLAQVFTWTAAATHVFTSVVMSVMSCLIAMFVKQSEHKVKAVKSHQAMVMQLVAISLLNTICWSIIDAFYLISTFVHRYPINIIYWVTLGVFPMNAVVSPAIFIINFVRKYHRRNKQKM